jgi:hypothetical protein
MDYVAGLGDSSKETDETFCMKYNFQVNNYKYGNVANCWD